MINVLEEETFEMVRMYYILDRLFATQTHNLND